MPINPDGLGDIRSATVDGREIQEITVDGTVVFRRRFPLDSFEYGSSTLHSRYTVSGSTAQVGTASVSYAVDGSRVAFVGDGTSTASFHTVPAHGTLPEYPAPGTRFLWHFRLSNWESGAQTWFMFGGSTDFTSSTDNTMYEVNIINDGSADTFRLRTRGTDGSGSVTDLYTSASAYESTGGNPVLSEGTWYACVVDWFGSSHDGRTGVRGRLFDMTQPDPDTDSRIPYGYFDTVDFPHNPDGSSVIPQQPGRMGARQSGSATVSRWDLWEMLPPR